jgi:hypothetical protein
LASTAGSLSIRRIRRILEARVLADNPMTLDELAVEFGVD